VGGFVAYRCPGCGYEEPRLPLGRGRRPGPCLALFRCPNCRGVGTTWVSGERPPACGYCYHEEIELLPDDTRALDCPRCGGPGEVRPLAETWE